MFSDEDLFTITIQREDNLTKGQSMGCQTEPLQVADQETHTLKAIHDVEIQADPNEIYQVQFLKDEEFDIDRLAGFLRSRFAYTTNTLKEYGVLQNSKRRVYY